MSNIDGFVKNISPVWLHAMKRAVGPGSEIPLNELYEQYGVKYGLNSGLEFVRWLRDVKLRDVKKWKIVLNDNTGNVVVDNEEEKIKQPIKKETINDGVAPMVSNKLGISDIVSLSVRQARDIIPGITDLQLLKYSFQEANQLAGKDSLCRIIKKRIQDLQIAR